ncbi:hypothetical protein SEEGA711_08161 [Salmonella enterica subsp. enterica serovar Gaminara str. ATCC BAA-711]|nr:hypothetical protein SEEGA711_08161 [Salmonella enterica subsp. enterica serovar Gaminara str. ATCC BAA-711]
MKRVIRKIGFYSEVTSLDIEFLEEFIHEIFGFKFINAQISIKVNLWC